MRFLPILVPTLSGVLLSSFIQFYSNWKNSNIFSSASKFLSDQLQGTKEEVKVLTDEIEQLKIEIQQFSQEKAIAVESSLSNLGEIEERSDAIENSSYFWTYSLLGMSLVIIGIGCALYFKNPPFHDSVDQTFLKFQNYYYDNFPFSSWTPNGIHTLDRNGKPLSFEIFDNEGVAYTSIFAGEAREEIDLIRVLEVEEELNYFKTRAEHLKELYDLERFQSMTIKETISDGLEIVEKLQSALREKNEKLFQKEELLNSLQLKIVTLESQLSELPQPCFGIDRSVIDRFLLALSSLDDNVP